VTGGVIEFLKMLLVAPIELGSVWLVVAVVLLLGMGAILAWFVAFLHAKSSIEWRGLLSTNSRLKISWSSGWCAGALVLLANLFRLVYEDHVSLFGAMPYLIAVPLALLLAWWLQHGVRAEVKRYQRLVQGR
jgi:hypothetical protein